MTKLSPEHDFEKDRRDQLWKEVVELQQATGSPLAVAAEVVMKMMEVEAAATTVDDSDPDFIVILRVASHR